MPLSNTRCPVPFTAPLEPRCAHCWEAIPLVKKPRGQPEHQYGVVTCIQCDKTYGATRQHRNCRAHTHETKSARCWGPLLDDHVLGGTHRQATEEMEKRRLKRDRMQAQQREAAMRR